MTDHDETARFFDEEAERTGIGYVARISDKKRDNSVCIHGYQTARYL